MADVEGVSMSDARCIRLVSFLQNRFTPETQSACAAASSCAGSVGSATGSGICVAAGSGSVVVNHVNASAHVGNAALFSVAGEFRGSLPASPASAHRDVVSVLKTAPPKLPSSAAPLLTCYPAGYLSAAAAAAAFAATNSVGQPKAAVQQNHPANYPASLAVVDTRPCHSFPTFPFTVDLPRFAHSSKDVAAMFAHARTGMAASRIVAAAAGADLFADTHPGGEFTTALCHEAAGRKEPRSSV